MGALSGDDIGQLIYLVILATVIGGYFFASARESLGKSAQALVLWGLIFLGVMAGYGLWSDIQDDLMRPQAAVTEDGLSLPRAPDGHFYVTAEVNGAPIRFLVDTGATDIVLSREDARRVGIELEELAFLGRANTANGPVKTAQVRLESIEIGQFRDEALRASVNGGELGVSLLGQRYLNRFERIEITARQMRLSR